MPLSAAVIVVLPMATPAANPLLPLELLTSAIVASAEAHVTNWVDFRRSVRKNAGGMQLHRRAVGDGAIAWVYSDRGEDVARRQRSVV